MNPKINAWLNQIASGKIKSDNAKILKHIINNPGCTIPQLELLLFMRHETVTARLSGLMDEGVVYVKGQQKASNNGLYSCFYYEPAPEKQLINAGKRKQRKVRSWANRGLREFKEFLSPSIQQELSEY